MSTGGFDAAAWTSYAKALVPSESFILSGAGGARGRGGRRPRGGGGRQKKKKDSHKTVRAERGGVFFKKN